MTQRNDDLLLPNPVIEVPAETLAEIRLLYHEAFRLYGSVALWSCREHEQPSAAEALAIAVALRTHVTMASRRHAEQIEALCRAA